MWLSLEELEAARKSVIDSGLLMDVPRLVLLRGLPGGFAASLRTDNAPLVQFTLDLTRLDKVERLAGGLVPIVPFLRNIASELKLRSMPEAELFERLANAVENRTRGRAVTVLPEPAQLPEVTKHEVIVGRDDTLDFGFLSKAITVGRSVARILVPKFVNNQQVKLLSGEPWLARGTAWLIAPRLVVTNHHVINARSDDEPDAAEADFKQQAKSASLEFDFDQPGSPIKSVSIESLVHASRELDYAILRLPAETGRTPLAINPDRVQMTATSYVAVNIIQHPRGEAKRVAMRNNLVTAADEDLIRYFTDTDFGSSGSPVCGDDWRVVALHRGAKYASGVSYQGKETAFVNFGSQIQAILEDIEPALKQEIIDAAMAPANPNPIH